MNIKLSTLSLVILALVVAGLAACAAPAAAPTATAVPAPTAAPTTAPAAKASVALQVVSNSALGQFLADGQGRTLYLFTKDSKNTSVCYDKCAQTWPALISDSMVDAKSGVNAALIGSTKRNDGSMQVTYNGWPLYYYAPDQAPGDVRGQGVGKVWWVVSPSGDPIQTAVATPAAQALTIQLVKNDKFGQFLADGQGRTLYLFTKDSKNTSTCYDKCAQNWPALISSTAPVAKDGVNSQLFGTTTRNDGSIQVTYNGWPLYYFTPDQTPGDVKGQGVGNVWWVVSATGDAIQTPAASAGSNSSVSAPATASNSTRSNDPYANEP